MFRYRDDTSTCSGSCSTVGFRAAGSRVMIIESRIKSIDKRSDVARGAGSEGCMHIDLAGQSSRPFVPRPSPAELLGTWPTSVQRLVNKQAGQSTIDAANHSQFHSDQPELLQYTIATFASRRKWEDPHRRSIADGRLRKCRGSRARDACSASGCWHVPSLICAFVSGSLVNSLCINLTRSWDGLALGSIVAPARGQPLHEVISRAWPSFTISTFMMNAFVNCRHYQKHSMPDTRSSGAMTIMSRPINLCPRKAPRSANAR